MWLCAVALHPISSLWLNFRRKIFMQKKCWFANVYNAEKCSQSTLKMKNGYFRNVYFYENYTRHCSTVVVVVVDKLFGTVDDVTIHYRLHNQHIYLYLFIWIKMMHTKEAQVRCVLNIQLVASTGSTYSMQRTRLLLFNNRQLILIVAHINGRRWYAVDAHDHDKCAVFFSIVFAFCDVLYTFSSF